MKAVAFTHSKPVTDPDSLLDLELAVPVPRHHDLLVEIKAVSVNPVDTKIRVSGEPLGEPRVLGFDAAGIVRAIGPEAQNFAVDRFRIPRSPDARGTLLIVGGAGGVGSIAIQLAAKLTGLTIIATASRPETAQWCRELGAHHVINHHEDMAAQVSAFGLSAPDYIFCVTNQRTHFKKLTELLAPEGAIGIIESSTGAVDISTLIRKCGTLHTEYMFARGVLHTATMEQQHLILEAIAHLVDNGTLKTTMTGNYGIINAANLKHAHAAIEAGTVRGKIVLEGF
jgi:zinc-binding alcohol dehydrogenase family protein